MPLIPLHTLMGSHPSLWEIAQNLRGLERGLVLTTGQMGSGKQTTLVALAHFVAHNRRSVHIVTDQIDNERWIDVFRPLPENWSESVASSVEQTDQVLATIGGDDTIVLTPQLTNENAKKLVEVAKSRVVMASVDTPFMGSSVAYAVNGMGVPYEDFAEVVVCIWAQLLVPVLCPDCAQLTSLTQADSQLFFLNGNEVPKLKKEVGCEKCDRTGTRGRDVLSDVTFIGKNDRPAFKTALVNALPWEGDKSQHVGVASEARKLLERGELGVNTYREMLFRNPLLRVAVQI